ncbi:MAG: enoyl-CoA hydratase/isomerase family protein [Thermomicrobiaceae bacterium]|nr:enoyl-CoA hydratase/isomerase family protein [Thermomicrobiaceae bacterium]
MAGYENILVETLAGGVGLIRINRPKRLNALNRATMAEIADAVAAFERDDAVRAIVLTGDERAFAAGADIGEFDGMTVPAMIAEYGFEAWEALRQARKPLIAAVSGYALGGGCELAMLCDLIVASDTARFGQPEVNLGVMPGAGGTQRLTRQLGKYLAMEVVLAGRQLGAEEALRHGLVNRVVPVELYLEAAIDLAREIAARAPVAIRLARDAVLRAQDTTLEVGLAYERHNFYLLFGTEDQREGVRAFLEKRAPEWRGR